MEVNKNYDQSKSLAIYGFGSAGQSITDSLLKENFCIDLIIDKNKFGTSYKNIPIIDLQELEHENNSNRDCLIALHNHYIDIRDVYKELIKYNFAKIWLLAQIPRISKKIQIFNGYWLDLSFNYAEHKKEIEAFKELLADKKSVELASQIIRYREYGNIEDYPEPSLFDEYTPKDLPKYKGPLKIIDCGAYTGIALEKFLNAGYEIDSFVAFEPDINNFEKLSRKKFNVRYSICLPLGVWSSNVQLHFNNNASMGSCIDGSGDSVIQCVSVDDVLNSYEPNLIKLDVEGAEVEAIKGLKKTIKNYKPNLAVSVYHKPSHIYEIALLINSWNIGYQFYLRVHEHNTYGVVLYCLQADLVMPRIA
jgi:FkbM family methyltransferase